MLYFGKEHFKTDEIIWFDDIYTRIFKNIPVGLTELLSIEDNSIVILNNIRNF